MSYVSDCENDSEDLGMDIDVYGDNKVDDGDEEVDEGENEEDKKEQEAGEEEDVDEEADNRYSKQIYTAEEKKPGHMRCTLQLSFQQDARLVDGVLKAGAYCCWCL